MALQHNNFNFQKTAYQLPFVTKRGNIVKNMHQSLVDNKHQLPFKDILEPLHPLHGGIGFTPISNTSNRATLLVQATNYLKPNISKHNRDIIHSCVFVNENTILEATPQRKKYNGNNRITDENKKKTSIYVSKFPILNIMITQEMKKLTGGEYNFIGTLNCVYGANILPKMKQDDFFCSQMLLKAMKNALIRYKSTPLLKDKQEIEDISQALAHLDPDLTLPAEIKEAIDKMPHYFTRKSFETLH